MLNKKIAHIEEEASKEEENKTTENRTSTRQEPSTTEVVGKSVLKVLTSATFIRGAFGILSKILRK